jgi:hypothetical protein
MKRQEFWMCSRRCILMFVALALVIGVIIIIIVTTAGGGGDDSGNTDE